MRGIIRDWTKIVFKILIKTFNTEKYNRKFMLKFQTFFFFDIE